MVTSSQFTLYHLQCEQCHIFYFYLSIYFFFFRFTLTAGPLMDCYAHRFCLPYVLYISCVLSGMLLIQRMLPCPLWLKSKLFLPIVMPFAPILVHYQGVYSLGACWAWRQADLQEVLEELPGPEPRHKVCSECSLQKDAQ